MKICPVCKSRCFDDMNVCYGCMYDFTKEKKDNHGVKAASNNMAKAHKTYVPIQDNMFDNKVFSNDVLIDTNLKKNISNSNIDDDDVHIPEYFVIDEYPMIEDIDSFYIGNSNFDEKQPKKNKTMESFLTIDDRSVSLKSSHRKRGAHEKNKDSNEIEEHVVLKIEIPTKVLKTVIR